LRFFSSGLSFVEIGIRFERQRLRVVLLGCLLFVSHWGKPFIQIGWFGAARPSQQLGQVVPVSLIRGVISGYVVIPAAFDKQPMPRRMKQPEHLPREGDGRPTSKRRDRLPRPCFNFTDPATTSRSLRRAFHIADYAAAGRFRVAQNQKM
jgi:hypothetical protein